MISCACDLATDMCMVFEVLGDNLLSLIKAYKYKGIPVDIVRKITRSVGGLL